MAPGKGKGKPQRTLKTTGSDSALEVQGKHTTCFNDSVLSAKDDHLGNLDDQPSTAMNDKLGMEMPTKKKEQVLRALLGFDEEVELLLRTSDGKEISLLNQEMLTAVRKKR